MKIESIEQARNMIEKLGIIPDACQVVNFYRCGHVFAFRDDVQRLNSKGQRCCPDCDGAFLVKYKICECGLETIGKKLFGGWCQPCSKSKWSKRTWPERKLHSDWLDAKAARIDRDQRASVERYDCEYRDYCLDQTIKANPNADALPCYRCKRYSPAAVNMAALVGHSSRCVVGL